MKQQPLPTRRRSTQPTARSGSLSTILNQPGSLPKPIPKAQPEVFRADDDDEQEQSESDATGFGLLLNDKRAAEREDALSLEHLREVVGRASVLTGMFSWLLAPFTRRVRMFHARLETIEAKLLAILGDRQAAVENKALAERCAHLEGTLEAERRFHEQQFNEQRDRAQRLKNVLLEVRRKRSLLVLSEIAAGKQGDREKTVQAVEATEALVQQTLAMDDEAFGATAENAEAPAGGITSSPFAEKPDNKAEPKA